MAEGMGVEISSVYAVNEGTNVEAFFATFGLKQGFNGTKQRMKMSMAPSPNMFVPKSIEFNKTVNVVYKIK